MKKEIDKCIRKEMLTWPVFIHSYFFDSADAGEKTKQLIDFLCSKFSFGYENPFKNTFTPSASFDGKRTVLFSDLDEKDFLKLEEVLKETTNSYLLAKINDVLYIHSNKNSFCLDASKYFIEIVNQLCTANKAFLARHFLQRGLFLLKEIDESEKIIMIINHLLIDNNTLSDHNFAIIYNAIFEFIKVTKYNKFKTKDLVIYAENKCGEVSDESLSVIKTIIDYYSSISNKENLNIWLNKYADYCEKLCEIRSPNGYKYISKAIEMLSKLYDLNSERINNLEFKSEEEQKKFFEAMNFQSIQIDGEVNEELNKFVDGIVNQFKAEKDSIKQLTLFLKYFVPITAKELKEFSDRLNESIFTKLSSEVVFDTDKKIVDEIGPDDDEKRNKQNTIQAYGLFHQIYTAIALGYLQNIKVDNELNEVIKDIVSNNLLVPDERKDIVYNKIIDGLNKNIRSSVYDLIPQFEFGCEQYFRSIRIHPTVKAGSKQNLADLNHFLTMDRFREPLKSIIGDDLLNELQYLLVDKRYGNLRNVNYHRGFEKEDTTTNIEILSFFRIFCAYCLGYNK